MTSAGSVRHISVVPARVRAEVVLVHGDTEMATWPLWCRGDVGLSTVDELARLHLDARRRGCSIWLRDACPELAALLRLVGLSEVLQVGRKAEELEE